METIPGYKSSKVKSYQNVLNSKIEKPGEKPEYTHSIYSIWELPGTTVVMFCDHSSIW